MKKKILSSNCITLMLFCQIALCFLLASIAMATSTLSGRQSQAIVSNCDMIHQKLQTVRTTDARARTYLGSYYEKIYSGFIIPLNLRLTRNNQPNANLSNLQISFAEKRERFKEDYTDYQRSLEELSNYDCKNHPQEFYDLLNTTRTKRSKMVKDVANLRAAITEYIEQVKGLKQ